MAQLNGGSVKYTASGAIGTSGKPVTVYSYSFLSGGSPGVVILKDTDNSGIERHEQTGTASVGTTVVFGETGKFFPNGCYWLKDANTTYLDVDFVVMA